MKEILLKIAAVVLGVPVLFFIGTVLFWMLNLISSIVIFLVVLALISTFGVMLWAMLNEYLGGNGTFTIKKQQRTKDNIEETTIIIEGDIIK